jgi:hypothetical protein
MQIYNAIRPRAMLLWHRPSSAAITASRNRLSQDRSSIFDSCNSIRGQADAANRPAEVGKKTHFGHRHSPNKIRRALAGDNIVLHAK